MPLRIWGCRDLPKIGIDASPGGDTSYFGCFGGVWSGWDRKVFLMTDNL
jgi:hypothetical protein